MSKRAVIYSRVSTDEQADRGYSLRDQEARLREYCRRSGITVAEHFQDDASAKTFERPAFRKLLSYVQANRRSVDELLVVKWDRFSRDATGALGMIRTLEGYGVDVQAIEQPIDRHVPEQLMMLAIYVAAPEVENRRRSLATKAGMRRAMKEGRWVIAAPIGYKNSRDESGRAILVPGPQAEYVRLAFQIVADNPALPIDEAMRRTNREARKQGLKAYASRTRFHVLLRNELYAGRIRIPGWQQEPEEVVRAVHEPLVSEHLFERVQQRFNRPKSAGGRKWKTMPELHMRGHVLCVHCGEPLTGSGSRGNGGRYFYYHCHRCSRVRVRAEAMHEAFRRNFWRVQLPEEVRELYRHIVRDLKQSEEEGCKRRSSQLTTRIAELEEKLFSVDEAYIERRIEADSYARMKERYASELRQARAELAEAEEMAKGFADKLEFAVSLLSDLAGIYDGAPVEARREMLVRIWPDHLTFDGESFRTKPESDIIGLLGAVGAENRNTRSLSASGVPCGTAYGIRSRSEGEMARVVPNSAIWATPTVQKWAGVHRK